MAGLKFRSALLSETAISSELGREPVIDGPRGDRVRLLWLGYAFARKGLVLAIDGFAPDLAGIVRCVVAHT